VPQRVLVDGLGYELRPATEEELVRGLTEIDDRFRAAGEPRIAMILADPDSENPPGLSMGLGGDEYVLVFDEGHDSGEGAYSRGPHKGDDSEVWFAYGDSDTEYQRWMLVDRGTTFEAAREFFRTGRRPQNVEWQEL
jgi:hypothetical protein